MITTARQSRTTALLCGAMAEMALGTVVLVLSTSPITANQAVFGLSRTIMVLAGFMGLLAAAMLGIGLAARLGRGMLQAAVIAASTVVGGLGTVAFVSLMEQPDVGFLLFFCWAMTLPVARTVTRAHVLSRKTRRK